MFASPGSTSQPPLLEKRASARGSVQSEKFVEAHGGKTNCELGTAKSELTMTSFDARNSAFDISSNPTTRRLAVMNLALRGIEADAPIANVEVQMSNALRSTSTVEIRHSNFA